MVLVGHVDKIDHRDANGQTSCHLAALNGEVECIKTLLEQGAMLELSFNERSFLASTVAGCEPLLGDKEGKTIAHVACIRDQFQALKLLFDSAIDLQIADKRGRFPMHIAAANGSKIL